MVRPRRWCAIVATTLAALACNQGLEPVPLCPLSGTGLCGTVRLHGTVPDSTDVVFVVAFEHFPQSTADLFGFKPALPPQLPLGDTIATYVLDLPPGRYEWVLAVWKKEGGLSVANADSLLREAGFYRDPADATQPGAIVVNGRVRGVDFVVDFDDMHPVSFYFPSAGVP